MHILPAHGRLPSFTWEEMTFGWSRRKMSIIFANKIEIQGLHIHGWKINIIFGNKIEIPGLHMHGWKINKENGNTNLLQLKSWGQRYTLSGLMCRVYIHMPCSRLKWRHMNNWNHGLKDRLYLGYCVTYTYIWPATDWNGNLWIVHMKCTIVLPIYITYIIWIVDMKCTCVFPIYIMYNIWNVCLYFLYS
jgi:hypothetical protein